MDIDCPNFFFFPINPVNAENSAKAPTYGNVVPFLLSKKQMYSGVQNSAQIVGSHYPL